jgi:hypothetical protein
MNVTAIEQEELGAIAAVEQLLAGFEKSAELLPLTVTVVICSVALPELVTVTLTGVPVVPCVMVGKFTGFGAMVIAGAGAGLASPETLMTCGESGASSASEIVSVRWPGASGMKVTEIEQAELGAMAPPEQLLAGFAKSPELLPPIVKVELCNVALPELVTVMFI